MEKTLNQEETVGKRERLTEWILEEIRNGQLKPGYNLPTRFKLASTFNCSRATVDHVMKNLINEKILVAEQGKGTYVPPQKNRAEIDAIAIINCFPEYPWSTEIEQGFLRNIGIETKVNHFSGYDIRIPSKREECMSHKFIVLIMPDSYHAFFMEELRAANIPHLVLYRDPPESSFINIDHRAAGRAIVAALKAKGCHRLAWVSKTESRFKTPEERYAGFLEGLLEQGLAFRKEWAGFFPRHNEADYLRSLFSGPEKPDALVLFLASIPLAMKAIHEAGLESGKDVQVASMDELQSGQYPFPILCTAKLTERIGQEAARLVLQGKWPSNGKPLQRYLTPDVLLVN